MQPQPRILGSLALLFSLTAPAFAGDYYVDPVHGRDRNVGTPMKPWRTIAHALAVIPDTPLEAHTVHLAPGVYGDASGEMFPLWMRPRIRLVGTQGSAATILEGPSYMLLVFDADAGNTRGFHAFSGAEGVTLRDATYGIYASASKGIAAPGFRDVVVRDCEAGVYLVSSMNDSASVGSVATTFDHVTIAECNSGIELHASGSTSFDMPRSALSLADCTVRDCATDGVAVYASYAAVDVALARSRFTGNGGSGVFAVADHGFGLEARVTVDTSDSLFAANGDSGAWTRALGEANVVMNAKHCTFADNARYGAALTHERGSASSMCLGNSVLAGNAVDLLASSVTGRNTDCADGKLAGHRGCIAADPMFVDATSGDYRLAFGSPCVDAGDPAFATAMDLAGHEHAYDGNLDTRATPDMGAMEFAPLAVANIQRVGSKLVLELWGPESARAIVYASGSPLLATAEPTPYGHSYLVPGTAIAIAHPQTRSGAPKLIELDLPGGSLPSAMSFQALIGSSAAPAGSAWSNPIEMHVMP